MKSINIPQKDYEDLSAFLDGELSERERRLLENRMQREPALRDALDGLQETRHALRLAPKARAPRNFTLTPEMVGAVSSRWFNFARLAFGMASFMLILALAGNFAFPAGIADKALDAEPQAFSVQADQEQALDTAGGDEMGAAESAVVEDAGEELAVMEVPAEPMAEAEMQESEEETQIMEIAGAGEAAEETGPAGELAVEMQPMTSTEMITSTNRTGIAEDDGAAAASAAAAETGENEDAVAPEPVEPDQEPSLKVTEDESRPAGETNYWLWAAAFFGLLAIASGAWMVYLKR